MNANFEKYLALLESRAPESQKADFRAARELYLSTTRTPQMEATWWDRMFAKFGNKPSQSTFGNHTSDSYKNAETDAETKAKRDEHAKAIKKAEEEFPAAAETVTTYAMQEPGKVDAWVDYRLKPAIERAMKAGNAIANGDEFEKAEKETYKSAAKDYKDADKKAKEKEKQELKDAIGYAKEQEQSKKAEEERAAEKERFDAAHKKLDDASKNKERKYDATQPANASEIDLNRNAATNASKEMQAKEDAKATEKELKEKSKDVEPESDNTGIDPRDAMSPEQFKAKKEKEEKDKAAAKADEDAALAAMEKMSSDEDNAWMFGEAANIKNLRAAFESVYGDSSDYSDGEIIAICESCYRRSRAK